MCIVHRMTLRARQRRSAQLGQCLARLDGVGIDGSGCLELRIFPLPGDALVWQVEGRWRSVAARDAFLAGETLRGVLAEAIGADLIASLECALEPLQQVA
ncbi:antibiotic biosynthesis monooxygenase [Pseudomonas sp. NPDC077186]|uniref:antibiotic biosynthesis monooxygenase n=1 Tax=Pseudomonas sp. NPDC077186 TaxID=3364421 RepID=UPI0037C59F5A